MKNNVKILDNCVIGKHGFGFFPNKKKIKLTIETTNDAEIITKLFSDYPAPLVKRYDFIKGFDEGYLDFYSSKIDKLSKLISYSKRNKSPVACLIKKNIIQIKTNKLITIFSLRKPCIHRPINTYFHSFH